MEKSALYFVKKYFKTRLFIVSILFSLLISMFFLVLCYINGKGLLFNYLSNLTNGWFNVSHSNLLFNDLPFNFFTI